MDKIDKLKFFTFASGSIDAVEALWDKTEGNKADAYALVKDHAKTYGLTDLKDIEIDTALSEINDGMEVEWKS